MIGVLRSDPFVEKVRNGKALALFAEVELPKKDVRTIQLFPGIGAESWPCKGDKVAVSAAGGILYAAAMWDGEEPLLKPGEHEIYSRDKNRKKVARMHMDNEGNIVLEMEGDLDVLVKGNATVKSTKNITIKGSKIDLNP